MSTTQTISWIHPSIKSKTTSANMIKMEVDFKDGTPLGDITITRLADGFYAEDKGNYLRRFAEAETLRWEFEYPQSLVAEMEALPIGEGTLTTYVNHDALSKYMNMSGSLKDLINMGMTIKHTGTNMTPKKKKRKKRK